MKAKTEVMKLSIAEIIPAASYPCSVVSKMASRSHAGGFNTAGLKKQKGEQKK